MLLITLISLNIINLLYLFDKIETLICFSYFIIFFLLFEFILNKFENILIKKKKKLYIMLVTNFLLTFFILKSIKANMYYIVHTFYKLYTKFYSTMLYFIILRLLHISLTRVKYLLNLLLHNKFFYNIYLPSFNNKINITLNIYSSMYMLVIIYNFLNYNHTLGILKK